MEMRSPEASGSTSTSADETLLGIVYGNVSTEGFRIALSVDRARRGTFVKVFHDIFAWTLGRITGIERLTDLSFREARNMAVHKGNAGQPRGPGDIRSRGDDTATSRRGPRWDRPGDIGPIETIGGDMEQRYLAEGKVSASITILGYRNKRGALQVPTTPLVAGKPVYLADGEFIRRTVGMLGDESAGCYVGLLRGHDLKVHISINEMVQKHVSVIARTGSGKSYVVGVLLEEMLEKNIPVVVIDPHGEYGSLTQPNLEEDDIRHMREFDIKPRGYASAVTEFSPGNVTDVGSTAVPLTFDGINLEVDELLSLTGLKRTGSQLGVLHKAVRVLSGAVEYYNIPDIAAQAELDRNSAKWNVINALERLGSYGLFSDEPTPLSAIVRKGCGSVINLRGIKPHVQEIIVARLIGRLFRERKRETIPPLMLVVEEAHNFCPQKRTSISSGIITNVASEGRKFGLGLCIVTQRPARVDKNILSQCNTQMILRVTNPNDLKAIISSVEGLTSQAAGEIQRLPVGEAIIVGANIAVPIFVSIRVRRSQHGGKSVSIL